MAWLRALAGLALAVAVSTSPARASGSEPPPVPAAIVGPSGSIVILTQPPGARAWVNQRYVGFTPARADSLAPGAIPVVVESPAGTWVRPRQFRAEVRAGLTDTLRIDLRGSAQRASVEPTQIPVRIPPKPEGGGLPSLGAILPVAALGLGTAGAWARHEADSAYRNYLRTLDPARMRKEYRRSERLDRVSMTCWISAEVALAAAAWAWLHGGGPVPVSASIDDAGVMRLGVRIGDEGMSPPPRERGR